MNIYFCSKLKAFLLKNFIQITSHDNILVLPICTMTSYVNDENQWEKYYGMNGIQSRKIEEQLLQVGATKDNIYFYNYYSRSDSDVNWNKTYSFLVLPGGDAELGTQRMIKCGIIDQIKNFRGDIIAYSAGALMLFDKYFLSPNWYYKQMQYCYGLNIYGMPSWLLEVHYDNTEEMDNYIFEACRTIGKKVFAVTNDGLICYDVDSKNVKLAGEVYEFNIEGEKLVKHCL